jgi:hypothetical protein
LGPVLPLNAQEAWTQSAFMPTPSVRKSYHVRDGVDNVLSAVGWRGTGILWRAHLERRWTIHVGGVYVVDNSVRDFFLLRLNHYAVHKAPAIWDSWILVVVPN